MTSVLLLKLIFWRVADTKLPNKYICFEQHLDELDNFCGKP